MKKIEREFVSSGTAKIAEKVLKRQLSIQQVDLSFRVDENLLGIRVSSENKSMQKAAYFSSLRLADMLVELDKL